MQRPIGVRGALQVARAQVQNLGGLLRSTVHQILGGVESNLHVQEQEPFARYRLLLDGLVSPVALADDGRMLYVVDQIGVVYRYDARRGAARVHYAERTQYADGTSDAPLLDIRASLIQLSPAMDERGLLQMLFHPRDARRFFLYYTVPPTGAHDCDVVLQEWRMTEAGARAHREILRQAHPDANHFGSPVGFRDGALYLASGDGAADDARDCNLFSNCHSTYAVYIHAFLSRFTLSATCVASSCCVLERRCLCLSGYFST